MAPLILSRRRAALLLAAAPLVGCGEPLRSEDGAPIEPGSLEWAAAGDWRIEPERDVWRHPVETLRFWGVEPSMTVLEILPGRGWMTAILAPYLARGGGRLIVASVDPTQASPARQETLADFDRRFADTRRFGEIERTIVSDRPSMFALPRTVDLAILANNLHTLMAEGAAERMFAQVVDALKPGGVFIVLDHAAAPGTGPEIPGTLHRINPDIVKADMQAVGFQFVGESDVLRNTTDDVTKRVNEQGAIPDGSNQFILKFRKP